MAVSPLILCSKALRALVTCGFLLLASLQPGLAAAVWSESNGTVAAEPGHSHDGDAAHDHGDSAAIGHAGVQEQAGGDHHQQTGTDLCCEMHCVMSQAMPASAPQIQAPPGSRVHADFAHTLRDGLGCAVIKPPRTIS